MLNKKGAISAVLILTALYCFTMIIFLAILAVTIQQAVEEASDTRHLQHYILYGRIIHSKNSVFYYDGSIGRVYPGVVDITKFYDDTLQDLFGEHNDFGIKLSLKAKTYDIFYNKELYQIGVEVFESTNPIYGGIRHSFPVVVEDNDVLLIGIMYER